MKNILVSTLAGIIVWGLVVLSTPSRLYADSANTPVTIPGAVQRDIASKMTGRIYRIFIYKPKDAAPERGYPVLYTLDGNSSFPFAALLANGMAQRSMGGGPGVVVGIGYPVEGLLDTVSRAEDYTPPAPDLKDTGDLSGSKQGGADRFLRFIEEELKPFVEKEVKIDRGRQTLYGHSYGGLFTLHTLFSKPDSFQHYVAASPSIWWGKRHILTEKDAFLKAGWEKGKDIDLRITVGGLEQTADAISSSRSTMVASRKQVENAKALSEELQLKGMTVKFQEFAGHNHSQAMLPALVEAVKVAFAKK